MNRRVIDYELLQREAAKGRTVNQLMSLVGVSAGTWYKRMDDDPEFKAAYVRGRDRGYEPEDVEASLEVEPEERIVDDEPETIEDEDDDETYDAEPEPSMREYIFQAVSLGLHLPRQIAKDLSVPIYEVVRDADAMVEAGDLTKLESVTFSGYYLPGTIPAGRPFLNGNGEIGFAIEAAASNGDLYSKSAEQIEAQLIDASGKRSMEASGFKVECGGDDSILLDPDAFSASRMTQVGSATIEAAKIPTLREIQEAVSSTATVTSVTVPLSAGSITIEADINLFSATQAEVDLFGTICQLVRDFRALDAGE